MIDVAAPHRPAKPAISAAPGVLLAAVLLLAPNQPAAARADSGGHPGDPYFALDHVLDVAVEMAPADWDRLRRQTRTLVSSYGGAECHAYPPAQAFSWFAADVTVDGQRYGGVGIRKKGHGSSSRSKPAFKIAFDKSAEGQALGGVLRRITLNNSDGDPSLLSTCLAYQVFAAAGLPAPRCNYARVAVNGEQLGLYVHVEDIERSLLQRAFTDAGGNLYEGGMYSDFRPEFRGTMEKETNRDAGDWSDVDAVVAALQDPTPAGLKALAAAVDLDRFLTFWAAEVLVGHVDGYAGNLKNFHFYREPDGRFVFIPWGMDKTFSPGAPAVLADGVIANRLYRDAAWRAAYAVRLRELLDTVWDETELLRRSERMAALVQAHALPERRGEAARGADRVRGFIRERRAVLLAAMESGPQDWETLLARPPKCWGEPTSFELRFETTWGGDRAARDRAARDRAAGTVTRYLRDGVEQAPGPSRVTAGLAGPEGDNLAVITLIATGADSGYRGVTVWLPLLRFVDGGRLDIRLHPNVTRPFRSGAVTWSVRPGATEPEHVVRINSATLELYAAGAAPGAAVSGRFYGVLLGSAGAAAGRRRAEGPQAPSLIINEVAARGELRDWFELYNASGAPLALADFMLADDLTDRSRRIPFLTGLRIEPGAYLRVELDPDRWPGFALGRDEELGIWTWYGRPVAQVDWQEGDSRRGTSYARVPDLIGPFRTVSEPTPGAPNAGALIDLSPPQPIVFRLLSVLAAVAAGELGAPAATAAPADHAAFDLYLDEAGTELIYYKEPCAPDDPRQRVYLHVFPADPAELDAAERQAGFYDRSFWLLRHGIRQRGGGACVALVPLPAYQSGIARIRTGQFNGWEVEFPAGE